LRIFIPYLYTSNTTGINHLKNVCLCLEGAIHTQLNWATLLCDVIPNGKTEWTAEFWLAITQASELSFTVVFHTENCAVHSGNSTHIQFSFSCSFYTVKLHSLTQSVQSNIAERSHNVSNSSTIVRAWHYFTLRERFYGELMSTVIAKHILPDFNHTWILLDHFSLQGWI